MFKSLSNPVEVEAFCRATREPDIDRALKVIAVGRATMALLDARDDLERALADLYGEKPAAALMAPLQQAAHETWRKIDAQS